MSLGALAPPSPIAAARQRLADYVELTKPRIATMALVTVAVGSFVATPGRVDVPLLIHTLIGTGLVAAGASVLNQLFERNTDALMRRTRNRPLPAGRVTVGEAAILGVTLSAVGIGYLCLLAGVLTCLLAAITLLLYAFVYTPMKRWTSLNTLVGAIPGALPPMMGWAAVRGSIDVEAWMLFLIMFLWQFPHFLAIAWIYREDYARAGLKMLPVVDKQGGMTGRQIIGYTLALLPASLVPGVIGIAGRAYFFGALGLWLAFLSFAVSFALFATQDRARNLMRASLVYLPTLLVFMMLDLV
jgi:protoheme IX farnesyltransferase